MAEMNDNNSPLAQEPMVGSGVETRDDDQPSQGEGAMTLEGLAHIYENNAYNAARELSDMSGDLYKIAAKANITARERDTYMRIIANLQLERLGHLDEEELILAHMALGVGIEGERAKDIVTIAAGPLQRIQGNAEAMGRGVRGMFNRTRSW